MLKSHPTWVRGLKLFARLKDNTFAASHPTWVRGLKLDFVRRSLQVLKVAPYVGAWIETYIIGTEADFKKSHPTWVRGLKHYDTPLIQPVLKSHPTWVRGLKHHLLLPSPLFFRVAPYVGAWIETVKQSQNEEQKPVAPYVGAWIETSRNHRLPLLPQGRTLRGCVD